MAGIYIHIPFCKQACHYCDFHFSTSLKYENEMIAAICKEIELQRKFFEKEIIASIYFGGGTPSLVSTANIAKILETINKYFVIENSAEITLEANPDDLSKEKIKSLKDIKINRLSIGIQSFDEGELKFLNRVHNSQQAEKSVKTAQDLGIGNISIDLIYGIPHSKDNIWFQNMEKAFALNPTHLSCYALTVEQKTVFGNWLKKGKITVMSEDDINSQFLALIDNATQHNFEHYEISNFSKKGFTAVHNSSYWKGIHYLGVGPSAHSYNGNYRFFNASNNALYMKKIAEGTLPSESEKLTAKNKINEYIMLNMRAVWGCDTDFLLHHFTYDILKEKQAILSNLIEEDLIVSDNKILCLTNKGKCLADEIISKLIV